MKLAARNIIRCPGCSIPRRSRATCCHARDSPETLLRPPPQPTQSASSCQQPPWRSWSTERSTRLAWQPSWYVAGRPGSFPSTNWSCAFTNWSHQLGPLRVSGLETTTPRHLDTSTRRPSCPSLRRLVARRGHTHAHSDGVRRFPLTVRSRCVGWSVTRTPLKAIETSCVSSRGSAARACHPRRE